MKSVADALVFGMIFVKVSSDEEEQCHFWGEFLKEGREVGVI
jgi:hypothetical protein